MAQFRMEQQSTKHFSKKLHNYFEKYFFIIFDRTRDIIVCLYQYQLIDIKGVTTNIYQYFLSISTNDCHLKNKLHPSKDYLLIGLFRIILSLWIKSLSF